MLLVESAQSVANRLEATCLNGAGPEICDEMNGLPYIRAKLTGETETTTSSLVEAHRMNSPFIISNEAFRQGFVEKAEYARGKPLNWSKIAEAVFHFDPNALLHGVFMANLEDGRVRLPRAVSGFVEASDVREAASGGVKNNPLDPTGKIRAANYDKDVYSNVPYPRTEYTAAKITAYFNLDLALLRGYGLGEEAEDLLMSLALYKIRRFLSSGLRLRTACDLGAEGEMQIKPANGFVMPEEKELLAEVKAGIEACRKKFASPAVTEITTPVVLKKEEKPKPEAGVTEQPPAAGT
jgi:CRISPR-associated protein Csb1